MNGNLHIVFDTDGGWVPTAGQEWDMFEYVNYDNPAAGDPRGPWGTFTSVTADGPPHLLLPTPHLPCSFSPSMGSP